MAPTSLSIIIPALTRPKLSPARSAPWAGVPRSTRLTSATETTVVAWSRRRLTPLVTEVDPADVQQFIDYNTLGCLHMCQLVVPQMRAQPRGDVVMVSSFSAQALRVRMGAYSISKAGMEALAQTLAKEERENGIRVNIVAPGLVDTAMGDGFLSSRGAEKKTYEEDAPFGFICQPEDVAGTILYLVSNSGRYVTGQRVTVNGGGF